MENNIPSMEENSLVIPEIGERKGKAFSAQIKGKLKEAIRLAKSWWLFFAVLLIWIGIMQYIVAEKYQADVKVVGENAEISTNATTNELDFGSLPQGNSSTRFVTIGNNGKYDVYVLVYKWGGVGKFMEVNRNDFVLKPGESENLEFMLNIPSDAGEKEYGGRVLIFKIPKIL